MTEQAGIRILNGHGLALFRHDDLGGVALHCGNKLIRVRLDDWEGAVVTRKHALEFEEALDCQRRDRWAHSEAIADWHHRECGLMDLRDQAHV